MADDEYEILPHQLLEDLKYDVESLKKKLNEPDNKTNELIVEIESLKDSIHELTTIFQKSLEEMKGEDVYKLIKKLNSRITELSDQNEIIAKGMVTISEKVEHFSAAKNIQNKTQHNIKPISAVSKQQLQQPVQHMMGLPTTPGIRTAPLPQTQLPPQRPKNTDLDLPPPPPTKNNKKSGLFK